MAAAAETGQKTFCRRQKPLNNSNKTLIRQLFTDDRNPAVAAATPGTTVLGLVCDRSRTVALVPVVGFMKDMELGVLSDMPGIQEKACWKLIKQQVGHRDNLLSSYKEMVGIVVNMVNTSMSLRCFPKGGIDSPLIQFSNSSNDTNDNGDGGGMPVFIFQSISYFEKLAWELVEMFKLELNLKRLLVIEFLSLRSKEDSIIERMCWSDEIYQGEVEDLSRCSLDCRDASESAPTKLDGFISDNINQPDVLQVRSQNGFRSKYARLGCTTPYEFEWKIYFVKWEKKCMLTLFLEVKLQENTGSVSKGIRASYDEGRGGVFDIPASQLWWQVEHQPPNLRSTRHQGDQAPLTANTRT
ncbi:hypothetical protein E3N88_42328 [Mikania micrantha]|uniref:Uncharacterized protein n=1 Tax=Mikania micrantha TaxID=192012 RepID=A0A5N6LI21_9ASTR|nr:hypothetical protein E3N88_42328 [Mikania micrantha]